MIDKEFPDERQGAAGSDLHALPREPGGARLLVVLCTVGDDEAAEALARALVEERLAACVSRAPVQSTYRWKDAVESQGEVLLVIKTLASLWPSLRRRIRALHTYECPEIVAVDVVRSDPEYLAWLVAACGGTDASQSHETRE